MHATGGHVQAHLAHGDAHAVRAQVAQAQDALAVGHHDEVHLRLGQSLEDLIDVGDVLRCDVDTPVAPLDVAHLHAGLAHGGGVDDGDHLLQVLQQQAVEEGLAAILQARQVDVALQVVVLALVGLVDAGHLGVEGADARPQHAVQLQAEPLFLGEGRALVQVRVVEELPAPDIDLVVVLPRQGIDLEAKGLHRCLLCWVAPTWTPWTRNRHTSHPGPV